MLGRGLARIMREYEQPVRVTWETTCYPFHANGEERKHGEFESNEAQAKSWAAYFVHCNPMGAVSIKRL